MLYFLLIALVAILSPEYAMSAQPQFSIPLKCEINKTCWISRYMNLNTPDDPKDYRGGRLTDSDHNGVDFALRDLKQMEEGVDVLAVADGTVVGIRNNMPDIAVTPATRHLIRGKECGNGVTIDHGHGIKSQYCHMKFDSFKVKMNDQVKAGQTLGRVGLSGLSDYPHLHLTTLHNDKKIDPFVGPQDPKSTDKPQSLWSKEALDAMPYESGKFFNFGITNDTPDPKKLHGGQYRYTTPLTNPTKVVGCFEFFAINKGDKITLRLLDPQNKERVKHEANFPKYQARVYIFSGLKKPAEGWTPGTWQYQVEYASVEGKQNYTKVEKFEMK